MSDWITELRDFKLSIITGDEVIEVNKKSLLKFEKHLDFIKTEFSDDIITGSLALNIFGLLDRDISDIDILIKDSTRYSDYNKGYYYHQIKGNELDMDSRLGYKILKYRESGILKKFFPKKYKVDFFIDNNTRYLEVEYKGHTYKVQHPLDILETKSKLAGVKHNRDLYCILQ